MYVDGVDVVDSAWMIGDFNVIYIIIIALLAVGYIFIPEVLIFSSVSFGIVYLFGSLIMSNFNPEWAIIALIINVTIVSSIKAFFLIRLRTNVDAVNIFNGTTTEVFDDEET